MVELVVLVPGGYVQCRRGLQTSEGLTRLEEASACGLDSITW